MAITAALTAVAVSGVILYALYWSGVLTFAPSALLEREQLTNALELDALCNDGSSPIIFKSLNSRSKEWLFYVEGGADCYNKESCEDRYTNMAYLMTGAFEFTPPAFQFDGFLSRDCQVNPAFCNANIVLFHYCSSDLWGGDKGASEDMPWHFRGKNIFQAMVMHVIERYPAIKKATRITLKGDSAGGMGVHNNGDRLGQLLSEQIPDGEYDYRMISDSAWWHKGRSYSNYPCDKSFECNIEKRFKLGQDMWNLQTDQSCAEKFGEKKRYLCLFLQEDGVIEEFSYPIMPVIYIYDQWQMQSDGIPKYFASELTNRESKWVSKRGQSDIETLKSMQEDGIIKAAFAINCVGHVVTYANSQVAELEVKGMTLEEAVLDYFEGKESVYINDDCGDEIGCNQLCITSW